LDTDTDHSSRERAKAFLLEGFALETKITGAFFLCAEILS